MVSFFNVDISIILRVPTLLVLDNGYRVILCEIVIIYTWINATSEVGRINRFNILQSDRTSELWKQETFRQNGLGKFNINLSKIVT